MKEIFETELKGNAGSTIKGILSFSKSSSHEPHTMPPLTTDKYEIVLEYHNGSKEVLKFTKEFETITEHSCYGEDSIYKVEKR